MALDDMTKRIVREMMDDPSCNVQMFRAVTSDTPHKPGAEFTSAPGKTVVLNTGGGANNVEIRHVKIEGEE